MKSRFFTWWDCSIFDHCLGELFSEPGGARPARVRPRHSLPTHLWTFLPPRYALTHFVPRNDSSGKYARFISTYVHQYLCKGFIQWEVKKIPTFSFCVPFWGFLKWNVRIRCENNFCCILHVHIIFFRQVALPGSYQEGYKLLGKYLLLLFQRNFYFIKSKPFGPCYLCD